jgi:hypothetical protein
MNNADYIVIVSGVFSLLALYAAFRSGRRRWLVESIPTSKTTGVFMGLVEVKGTAFMQSPLISHLAGIPCAQYSWNVSEHWSRTVSETYTDSKGETQTRTRHESGWTTVDSGEQMISFYLQDECGEVLVRPENATIEPMQVFHKQCSPEDPLYYEKGPMEAVSYSDHERLFVETAIPMNIPLYVMGKAREREDVVAAEIAYDKDAPLFLISTRFEEQVRKSFSRKLFGWFFLR